MSESLGTDPDLEEQEFVRVLDDIVDRLAGYDNGFIASIAVSLLANVIVNGKPTCGDFAQIEEAADRIHHHLKEACKAFLDKALN